MLDNTMYSHKPTPETIRYEINKAVLANPVDLEPEQLAQEIIKGKSFVPGYITTKVNGKLRRTAESWTSQQIVCLDIDNGYYDKKLKKKIKDVRMTWEEAKQEFVDTAMFMYKTFSHTNEWPKFRVVFAFEEPFNNINILKFNTDKLFEKYPFADESTFEANRIFFGGTELHTFDFSNRLKNDPHIVTPISYSPYIENNWGNNIPPQTNNNQQDTNILSNIDIIKSKYTYISERMNKEYLPITVSSRKEAYDYLKRINLHDYLGIQYKHCFDIFHYEKSPSSDIYQDPNTGYWWYKCRSDSNPFTGTIIEVTERLTKLNKPKSLKYLLDSFNITIQKSEWQLEIENLIQQNLELLSDEEYIKEAYPYLNSLLRTPFYYSVLREIHLIALENISTLIQTKESNEAVFYASVNHILKRLDRFCDFDRFKSSKEKRLKVILSLLVYLQLLNRIGTDKLPLEYVKRAKLEAEKKHYKNLITFWSLPSMAATHMQDVERLAKQFQNLGMTVGNFDRQMILKTLGEDEADRVFPMRKGEKLSELNEMICLELEKTMVKYIEQFGWVTEKRIIDNTSLDIADIDSEMRKRDRRIKEDDIISIEDKDKWLYELKRRQLKKIIGGLMIKYKLNKQKLNNELIEKENIPLHYNEKGNLSYPVVYFINK
ncbi:hypothetical protein [Paenibacillus faecalis]|uniref:hypothetical protein n=1 Tax=Paenibacillus faecalis TaxID=2079532 RepID=UPI00131A49AF|nr:hypothetical protein [Paenibacillus faecalis]